MVVRRFIFYMTEIYLVTQGDYSDYGVRGVFIDKALAEEYAAQISNQWSTAIVETRPVMTELIAPIGYRGYIVTMDEDGNTDRALKNEVFGINSANVEDTPEYYPVYPNPKTYISNPHYKTKYFTSGKYTFYIYTDKGEEGAIKIANERRVQMIANNTWPKKDIEINY